MYVAHDSIAPSLLFAATTFEPRDQPWFLTSAGSDLLSSLITLHESRHPSKAHTFRAPTMKSKLSSRPKHLQNGIG